MYMIADKNDKTMHWMCALDEGYEPYPHLNLTISFKGQKSIVYKLPVRKKAWEVNAVVDMLRSMADDIEKQAKEIQVRMGMEDSHA